MVDTLTGKKYANADPFNPRRVNWKMNFTGTGAEIDALDFDANLVSRYPFNDSPNDAVGANNLTASGSPTYVSGVYGKAISLNGSSMYLQAGANTVHDQTTNDFAICAYIYLNAISGTQIIAAKRNSGNTDAGYKIYVNASGKVIVDLCDGSATFLQAVGNTALSANTWYFVGVIFDRDGNMTIMLNESQDQTATISTQQLTVTNTQTFTVGRNSSGATSYLNGYIDQLQVFNGTVTVAQMQGIYRDLHAGQRASCQETGSGFTAGFVYVRNSENTAWVEQADISGTQEFTNKTLNASVLKGAFTASGTVTLPAHTLGGEITATGQKITNPRVQNGYRYDFGRAFLGYSSLASWKTNVSGTGAANDATPGIELTTGGTNGSTARATAAAALLGVLLRRDKAFEAHFLVSILTTLTTCEFEVGLFDGTTTTSLQGNSQDYCVFNMDAAVSTNWFIRNNDGGGTAPARVDTSVAIDNTNPQLLSIISDETSIFYYINGTLVSTQTTDLPRTSVSLLPRLYVKNTAGVTRTMSVINARIWSDIV